MQRSASATIRNSLVSMAGSLGPLVVALFTIPLLIHHAGAARFGALSIVWLLFFYFGQVDFGIGRAVTQRVAALPNDDRAARAVTICTALLLATAVAIVSAPLAGLAAYWFFSGPFDVSPGLRAELIASVWSIVAAIPLVAFFGVAHGGLVGSERFGAAALATLAGNAAMQLFPLGAAIWWSSEMPALVAASVAGRALGLLIALCGIWSSALKGQVLRASRTDAARILHLGKWIMLAALIGPLMVLSDRFAIGMQMGAIAVAAYAVPFQVANRTLVFPQSVLTVMFPRFAGQGEIEANRTAAKVAIVIAHLYAVPVVILICLAGPLLNLWIGADLDPRSVPVACILLAGFWVNALSQVPYNLLQARGNPRYVAQLHLFELPVYALLLVSLGSAFGLTGFALAFALRCLLDCLALVWRSGLHSQAIWPQLWLAAALVVAATLLHPVLDGWIPSVIAGVLLGGVAAWRTLALTPPEMRQVLRGIFVGKRL